MQIWCEIGPAELIVGSVSVCGIAGCCDARGQRNWRKNKGGKDQERKQTKMSVELNNKEASAKEITKQRM